MRSSSSRDASGPWTDPRSPGEVAGNGRPPVLTAVVFGYRDGATVAGAVRSLVTQESEDPFEVVVATSGGDHTAEIVRAEFPAVRVAESRTRLYPGGVRNLGIAVAHGDYVAFLEADCMASPNWVRHRIALHRAGHAAVAGAMTADASAGIVARAWLYLVHPSRLVGHEKGVASPHQAYGLSLSREALERAGPFDETVRSDEDTMMTQRLEGLGIHPRFDPAISIEHIGPDSLATLLRDQFHRGQLDSWEEVLRLPAGRLRRRWEPIRWARGPFVVLRALQHLPKRLRWIVWELRRARPEPFLHFLALAVPMALGFVAYHLGWVDDQLRAWEPAQYERRGELPIPTGVRRRVATTGDRVVSLAFTGGPSAYTRPILQLLERLMVPATFFVTAARARERPEDIRGIAVSGCTLGGSGSSGRPFTELEADELARDVEESNRLIAQISGSQVVHVHPPRGMYSFGVVSVLQRLELQIWACTSHLDGESSDADKDRIVEESAGALTPGAILCLRDTATTGGATRDALAEIIATAHHQGFRFVNLSEDATPDVVTRADPAGGVNSGKWDVRR